MKTRPRPLYRRVSAQVAKLMIERGSIKLNSPYIFHDEVKYGRYIGDSGEGKQAIHVDWVPVTDGSDIPKILKKRFPVAGTDSEVIVEVQAILDVKPVPSLIYCTFEFPTDEAIAGVPGDTWVEITDPVAFAIELSKLLPAEFECRGIHRCAYELRDMPWRGGAQHKHPLLVKSPEYAHQREVRMIWTSKTPRPADEIIFVESQSLAKFCRLYK